jgi:hypothetical protein
VAFGGSWEPMKSFAVAQSTLGISDFTTDKASSIVPDPSRVLRATYSSYPVSVTIPDATKQKPNDAPYGLGANFVEFTPGSAPGTLTLTFDGADGYAWRVYAIVYGAKSGPSTVPMTLDTGSAGSLAVSGFGKTATRVVLVATIADKPGIQVPFTYGASVSSTLASR